MGVGDHSPFSGNSSRSHTRAPGGLPRGDGGCFLPNNGTFGSIVGDLLPACAFLLHLLPAVSAPTSSLLRFFDAGGGGGDAISWARRSERRGPEMMTASAAREEIFRQ